MLLLGARFQRPLLAPSRCCINIRCKVSNSSYPHQVIQHVDDECVDFLSWLRHKSGVEISSLLSIGKSNYVGSLFACKPIQPGDCILKVPYSVQLAPDNLHHSMHSLLGEDFGDVAKLALVVLQHQRLGQESEWAPYISCLPRIEDMHSTEFSSLLLIFWSDEELKMIKISSLYHETLKHTAQIEKEFLSIKHSLTRLSSGIDTRRMQIARDLLTGELRILESASAWLKNYCETLYQTAIAFQGKLVLNVRGEKL